jgi:glycosyltransferase involved in cell wall biosynthesis
VSASSSPSVSVILPAFNAERFVRAAVTSVLAQTFHDFELIAIDDGSTDRTGALLDDLARSDGRLAVVHQPNAGLIATLNSAIDLARAPLIARMDADDLCRPTRLERQVAYMNVHPDVALLGGAYRLIDDADRPIKTFRPPTDHATLDAQCLATTQPICHPLAMIRRSSIDRVGKYDPQYEAAEDLDFFLRLAEVGTLACLDGEPLLDYRMHAASVSERKQHLQRDNQRKAVEAAYARRGIEKPATSADEWRPTTDADRFKWTCTYGWWALRDGHFSTARAYAWKALRARPTSREAWALLAKSAIGGRR